MPLAEVRRGVANAVEQLGDCGRRGGQFQYGAGRDQPGAGISTTALAGLSEPDERHVQAGRTDSGEVRGTRRRATGRRGIEIGEPHPGLRQQFEVRRADEALRDCGTASSICTEVLLQPWPSPRMSTKFGRPREAVATSSGRGSANATGTTPRVVHRLRLRLIVLLLARNMGSLLGLVVRLTLHRRRNPYSPRSASRSGTSTGTVPWGPTGSTCASCPALSLL